MEPDLSVRSVTSRVIGVTLAGAVDASQYCWRILARMGPLAEQPNCAPPQLTSEHERTGSARAAIPPLQTRPLLPRDPRTSGTSAVRGLFICAEWNGRHPQCRLRCRAAHDAATQPRASRTSCSASPRSPASTCRVRTQIRRCSDSVPHAERIRKNASRRCSSQILRRRHAARSPLRLWARPALR